MSAVRRHHEHIGSGISRRHLGLITEAEAYEPHTMRGCSRLHVTFERARTSYHDDYRSSCIPRPRRGSDEVDRPLEGYQLPGEKCDFRIRFNRMRAPQLVSRIRVAQEANQSLSTQCGAKNIRFLG